jgi:hypothetical protein
MAELPEQPQAREKLARRPAGQVTAAHRIAPGLCLKVGEGLEGEGATLLGAVRSDAPPARACRGRLHMDKRLGDDIPGLVDYLEPDVVGRGARAGCGLQPHAAAGE